MNESIAPFEINKPRWRFDHWHANYEVSINRYLYTVKDFDKRRELKIKAKELLGERLYLYHFDNNFYKQSVKYEKFALEFNSKFNNLKIDYNIISEEYEVKRKFSLKNEDEVNVFSDYLSEFGVIEEAE